MMYTEQALAHVAKRENNTKRTYLVVNPQQGKHVPVSGEKALAMFDALAEKVRAAYPGECGDKLLLVGFAETATAIGARLAVTLESLYIQTTREVLPNADYLYFTESHSHATEQKLCKNCIEWIIGSIDRIVFVEDEVTTGNTIMKIIDILESTYPGAVKFGVASLLNGMDEESLARYEQRGIDVHYLVKTHHENYPAVAARYTENGWYSEKHLDEGAAESVRFVDIENGYINTRKLCGGASYGKACESLAQEIASSIPQGTGSVCVIGTEEFMYPAIHTAAQLEKLGFSVVTHSTTRSPIAVCTDEEYPLHARYELASFYDAQRRTFIYDLKKYDLVVIITDSPEVSGEGLRTLSNALHSAGNENIILYRWYGNDKR